MGITGFNRWRRLRARREEDRGQAAPAPDKGESFEDELLVAVYEAACAGEVTKSGKPEVSAVEKRLGRSISAADRDRAWEIVKPEFEG